MEKAPCFFCWQSVRRRIAPRFAAKHGGLFTNLSTDSVDAGRTSRQNKHLARALQSLGTIPKTSYTYHNNTSLPATYAGDDVIPVFLKHIANNATPSRHLLFVRVRARRSKGMDSARTPIYAQAAAPHRAPALRRPAVFTRNSQAIEIQALFPAAILPGNPMQGAWQRASRPSSRACQQTCPQVLGMTRKSLVLATTWRAQFTGMTA